MKIIIALSLLIFAKPVFSQKIAEERVFDSGLNKADGYKSMVKDSESNIYLFSQSKDSLDLNQLILVKYNKDFAFEFSKKVTVPNYIEYYTTKAVIDKQNNIYLLSTAKNVNDNDLLILKLKVND